MICSEFFELLDNYESLTDEQRIEMEKHTAECETCRKELEFFESVIGNLASIPSPKAPESLIENVNAKLDAEKPVVIGFKWNFRVLSTVAACLAIGLAVGINNGYIRKNIEKSDTDGVIKETVVTTQNTNEFPTEPESVPTEIKDPVDESSQTEQETEVQGQTDAPIVVAEKPVSTSVPKQTSKPVTEPAKSTPVNKAQQKPAETQKPQIEPEKEQKLDAENEQPNVADPLPEVEPVTENTSNVDDYVIKEDGPQIAYGRYNIEVTKKTPNAFSDYLHVQSDDMGAVVSTMSEMGVKNSGGYYMTSRQNFYALMDTLNDKGVGYECDLQYNSGENISFRLTYN